MTDEQRELLETFAGLGVPAGSGAVAAALAEIDRLRAELAESEAQGIAVRAERNKFTAARPRVPLPIGRLPDSTRIVLLSRRHKNGAQAVWGCGKWLAECHREGQADYRYRIWDDSADKTAATGKGKLRPLVERECLEKMAEISGGRLEASENESVETSEV